MSRLFDHEMTVQGFGLAWDGDYFLEFQYSHGSSDYFSGGCWYPGDSPEIDFTSIVRIRMEEEDEPEGVEQDFTLLTLPAKLEQLLYEKCAEAAGESSYDDYSDYERDDDE